MKKWNIKKEGEKSPEFHQLGREIYQLFKELDLFSAHTFEEFIDRIEKVSHVQRSLLTGILKNFKPRRPRFPHIDDLPDRPEVLLLNDGVIERPQPTPLLPYTQKTDQPEPILIKDVELIEDKNIIVDQDQPDNIGGGGIAYINNNVEAVRAVEDDPFIVNFNPAWIEFWDSDQLVLPYPLIYYLRNYYDRFLEIMKDYFGVSDFETFNLGVLFDLFWETDLIEVINFTFGNPDHELKLSRLINYIHQLLLSQKGNNEQ